MAPLLRGTLWLSLAALSVSISALGYFWYGSIPVLLIGPRGSPAPVAPCGECHDCNGTVERDSGLPVNEGGASKMLETVPIKVLRESVSLSELHGLSHLDHVSLSRYYLCPATKMLLLPKHHIKKPSHRCTEKRFLNRQSPIVALISFHGSGNTWVRYLLEQATGVYTGSIYCDRTLKLEFPGEQIVSGSVAAVKTHQCDTTELPKDVQMALGKLRYDRAILLVRNPFDALISEANRRWNSVRGVDSHVGLADETAFISNAKWDWFVEGRGMSWGLMLHTWLNQNHFPVLVVQYETLVRETRQELERMLQFLEIPVSNETLQCTLENDTGKFKRTRHLNFDPFSQENKEAVNRLLIQAAPLLARHGIKYSTR